MTDESRANPAGRLAAAGVIVSLGVAVTSVIGAIRVKGLALTLDPAEFGVFGQLTTFATHLGTLGTLGVGLGAMTLVAARRQAHDATGLSTVVGLSVAIPVFAGSALLAVVLALSGWIAPWLIDEPRWGLVALAALSIPLVALQVPLQHVLQGFEDARGQTVAYVLYTTGFTAGAVAGAALAGVEGALVGLLLGNALLVFLYSVPARRHLAAESGGLGRRRDVLRSGGYAGKLLRIGAASLLVALAYSAADLVVRVALIRDSGQEGAGYWYALMLVSVQFVGAAYAAMSYLTAPLVSRAVTNNDDAEVRRVMDGSVRLTLLMVVPLVSLLAALREPLVSVLFGSSFESVEALVPTQMAGDLARAVAWSLGIALVPLGLTRTWLALGLFTSVTFAAVGTIASLEWGVSGAVASWVATWTLTAVVTAVVLRRRGHWRPSTRTIAGLGIGAASLYVASAAPGVTGTLIVAALTLVLFRVVILRSERENALARMRRLTLPRRE